MNVSGPSSVKFTFVTVKRLVCDNGIVGCG